MSATTGGKTQDRTGMPESPLLFVPTQTARDLRKDLGAAGVAFYAHIGGFLAGFAVAAASLKLGWIRPGRYERSLLDVLSGKGKPQSTHLGRWRR